MSGPDYLERVRDAKEDYPGFSLIAGDIGGLYLFSNRDPTESICPLPTGTVVGLTNTLLIPGWYKATHGVALMESLDTPDPDLVSDLAKESDFDATGSSPSPTLDTLFAPLFAILGDREGPNELESSNDVYDMAGQYAPIFVDVLSTNNAPGAPPKEYGTRCSIIVLVDYQNRITYYERSLDTSTRRWENRVFHFQAYPPNAQSSNSQ